MSWKPQHAICLCFSFLLALSLHSQAHADTYQLFQFTAFNGAAPVRYLDNQGNVVSNASFLVGTSTECPPTANTCYGVFQPFGSFYLTDTLPPFDYTGTVGFIPSGTSATLFNNGYEADYDAATRSLYGGPTGNLVLLGFPDIVALGINNYGDITWTDGFFDENYLAYDITAHETPEPATFALLATGLVLLAAFAHRRLTSSS
jgi:hypothetical protein